MRAAQRWISAAAVAAVGCGAPDGGATPSLVLEPCRLDGVDRPARCGVLQRPEDPGSEQGRVIPLRVAVVEATEASEHPPVLMLAGGPGQAATEAWPMLLQHLPFTEDRDVVLIDQRGTGASGPLDCPVPESLAARLELDYAPERVDACLRGFDADPRLYVTSIAVDDFDAVRAALGYERLDLIGGSYGTRAALVYLRQHPEHVRAVVLDGVAPVDMALPLSFAADGQRAFDRLVHDCDEDPSCRASFGDVRATFDAVLDTFDEAGRPVTIADPHSHEDTEIRLTRDLVAGAVRGVLYQPAIGALLPLTLRRAAEGDYSPLVAQTTLFSDSLQESFSEGMFLSVVCAEDVPFIGDEAVAKQTAGTYLQDAIVSEFRRACDRWPRGKIPDGYRDPVVSDVPVLLLSGDLDPATPPRWAEHAAAHLSKSRHLVVPGHGHGTLHVGCVPDLIETFLDDADPAALDASCLDDEHRPPFFIDAAGPPH